MTQNSREWHRNLERHVERCRISNPVPARTSLTREQALQFQIIKGSLLLRLNSVSVLLSTQNSLLNRAFPSIIITSNDAGLAAASDIKQEKGMSLNPLYPEELGEFLQLFPDPGYQHHIHIWSHFHEGLQEEISAYISHYPLNGQVNYWLHVEGVMCGKLFGRGSEHLWSWDGSSAKLLKKNFRQWVS